MKRAATWIGLSFAVSLMACAPTGVMDPAAVQRMSQVEASIRIAQEHGATRDPRAARHLALARAQVTEAQQLSNEGEHAAAKRKLARAALDAELAIAMARESNVRRDAGAMQARIEALRAPQAQEESP